MHTQDYDIIVIGGGLVGAGLACALGNQPVRVAVVEAFPFDAADQPSFDARTVAMSYTSKVIFDSLGLWADIQQQGATPIKRIHVSDRKHSGLTHLDCREQHVEALGYVVETRILGRVLGQHIPAFANVDYLCPATLESVSVTQHEARVTLMQDGQQRVLTTRLVVAADGGRSLVRQQAGVQSWQVGYNQTAVIANVAMDKPHDNIAYERFTDTGPMALLPSSHPENPDSLYALVWTVRDDQRDALLALDDAAFLARLQDRFGPRAGRFIKVSQRHDYPLSMMLAKEHVRQRLAFIGNAAHTMHPVAGQGFNLGLRDAAALAQIIMDAQRAGRDAGDLQVLQEYAAWRRSDHLQAMGFTDGLVRLFSSRLPPIILARNVGLLALDVLPGLKRIVTRQAMGYVGKLTRLARGLPL
ncbi:MAG: 2-octaprenyl-6-methoxyphenyl hydroxylase [Gammaproteobacteria bacterium]|nr:2-octaprenyl-6-methoxyphenyl hydroxylase [Gammaproteobacteria bacterium]MDH5652497.1 2-octaprenyl-6-methoxyphenyl hydroxylase [Gammaproteobacteria bacterium]